MPVPNIFSLVAYLRARPDHTQKAEHCIELHSGVGSWKYKTAGEKRSSLFCSRGSMAMKEGFVRLTVGKVSSVKNRWAAQQESAKFCRLLPYPQI
jgi:hypothetical protein